MSNDGHPGKCWPSYLKDFCTLIFHGYADQFAFKRSQDKVLFRVPPRFCGDAFDVFLQPLAYGIHCAFRNKDRHERPADFPDVVAKLSGYQCLYSALLEKGRDEGSFFVLAMPVPVLAIRMVMHLAAVVAVLPFEGVGFFAKQGECPISPFEEQEFVRISEVLVFKGIFCADCKCEFHAIPDFTDEPKVWGD